MVLIGFNIGFDGRGDFFLGYGALSGFYDLMLPANPMECFISLIAILKSEF